jgi:ADP-ribose pyrophosphatase YjhB (NUDIX family)
MHIGAAAVAVDRAGRVLLVEDCHEGERHFALPGGSVESGETPREAAARELAEECGVAAVVGDLLGVYVSMAYALTSFVFLATVADDVELRPDTSEVLGASWWDPQRLPQPRRTITSAALRDALSGVRGVYREV